jgi:hypothetical protein
MSPVYRSLKLHLPREHMFEANFRGVWREDFSPFIFARLDVEFPPQRRGLKKSIGVVGRRRINTAIN